MGTALPSFAIDADVRAERLTCVLSDWELFDVQIRPVCPAESTFPQLFDSCSTLCATTSPAQTAIPGFPVDMFKCKMIESVMSAKGCPMRKDSTR